MAKKRQPKSFDSLTFFTLWMQLRPLKISLLPTAKYLSCVASHITSAVRACIAAFLGTFQPVSLREQQTGRQRALSVGKTFPISIPFSRASGKAKLSPLPELPYGQPRAMPGISKPEITSFPAGCELGRCKMNPC